MSARTEPRAVRCALAFVVALDRLCGASRRYPGADDLRLTFADEARDEHAHGGFPRLASATLRAAVDLLADSIRHGWRPQQSPSTHRSRARKRVHGMQTFRQDLHFALRGMRRQPGFALAVVLTLTLGIAANSAIFTLVDGILLRPLPYAEPERLVRVWSSWGGERGNVNPLDVADWRRETPALADLAAWSRFAQDLTGVGEPVMVNVGSATASFFDVLGARPARGRLFGPDHVRPGSELDVVLSDGLWRTQFGADPSVIGRKIVVGAESCTVIGILPRGFASPGTSAQSEPQLWRPYVVDPEVGRGGHWMKAVGRLRAGATLDEARAQLAEISRRLERENPETNRGVIADPEPLAESISGEGRPALLLLMCAVGVVLLIACANVAHLLLARAAGREREMAVRGALGAGRGRLVRQLLTESLLFSVVAGLLGVGGAWLALRALPTALTASLPAILTLELDWRVVAFTLVLSAATTALFGLTPALAAARTDLRASLGAGARGSGGRAGRVQAGLLVAETALALVLLVSASLLVESFARLRRVDPGFDADRVLTFRLTLPNARYAEPVRRAAFFAELESKLGALPGVEAAGAVNMAPLSERQSCDSFGLADRPAPPPGEEPCAEFRVATRGYFRAMGIRQLLGRGFEPTDTAESAPVVVVSETMAREYWPEGNAVGQQFKWGSKDADNPWWTIVGVVADVKFFGLDRDAAPEVYMPVAQWQSRSMTVALRTARDPAALTPEARAAVAALDPELPLFELMTTRELVERSTVLRRFRTQVLAAFAIAALALALVGIHGVMAFYVAQRNREIGIRMSLGASPHEVRWQVIRRGMSAVLLGAAIGLAASFAVVRLLEGMLFGVRALDATAFVAAPLVLLATALVASFLPARRATRIDPLTAIRAE
jgi:putative ABC transport system permease protein